MKKKNENVMCSWYLLWQTLEVSGIAKKPNQDAIIIIKTPSSNLSLYLSRNGMLPTVPVLLSRGALLC